MPVGAWGEHVAIKGNRSIWTAESFGVDLLDLTMGDMLDQ